MKLQYIAAAVALAAAGTANAAMERGSNGNGSLILIAYDNIGGTTTAGVFDLGLSIDDLIGVTGNGTAVAANTLENAHIVWDFAGNSITVNGAVTSFGGTNNWTAAWNTLLANSDAADLRFVVTGFDTTGIGANKRSIVTGVAEPTAQMLNNNTTQANNTQQIAGSFDIFSPINGKGTHGSAANGAYTFTSADGATTRANGYAMADDGFAYNWRTGNLLNGETFAGTEATLWVLDGLAKERKFNTVNLNVAGGQLVMGAVPEPSTYALMFAGLVVAGVVARRRAA